MMNRTEFLYKFEELLECQSRRNIVLHVIHEDLKTQNNLLERIAFQLEQNAKNILKKEEFPL